MTLEKVREILELNLKEAGRKMPPDTATALGISIEGLKRILKYRKEHFRASFMNLPGETKED